MKVNPKPALLANAIFSSLSGIAMLLFNQTLSGIMGVNEPLVLTVIGVGLLFFASTIVYQATRAAISASQVKLIIVQDFLWVLASLAILAFQLAGLTFVGYVLVGVVALVVASFGFFQWLGLKYYSHPNA